MAAPFMVPSTSTMRSATWRWRRSRSSAARSSERATFAASVPAMRAPPPPIADETRAVRRTRPLGMSSDAWIDRLRLVAGVVVEPARGLPPVVPRGNHLAERGRRREPLLAVLVEHDVADGLEGVEANEVAQRQRSHRVVGASLHRGVDLLDRPDALLVGAHPVEQEGDEQAVDDEAGLVLGLHGELAELLAVVEAGLEGLVAGGHRAHNLEQRHDLHGVEEVKAQEAVGPAGGG